MNVWVLREYDGMNSVELFTSKKKVIESVMEDNPSAVIVEGNGFWDVYMKEDVENDFQYGSGEPYLYFSKMPVM